MYRYLKGFLAVFALLVVSAATSVAQQKQEQRPESQYVDFTGFKGSIFELKHRDPEELIGVLRGLTSGFKGATINANSDLKTITVRDFPENIATIEAAIKRLDVPAPARAARTSPKDVDITVHVLLASSDSSDGNQYPQALQDVVKQMQSALNYKSFQLLTTIVQRTNLRRGLMTSSGTTALPEKDASANYRLGMSDISFLPQIEDGSITIGDLNFQIAGSNDEISRKFGSAEVRTRLNVRPGEKVVVGTATLRDKAVILILTAKM